MTIHEHLDTFFGLPVRNFSAGSELKAPIQAAYRVSCEDYDDSEGFSTVFAELIADPLVSEIEALIVGCWDGGFEGGESTGAVEMLVSARDHFPKLRALFFGDIICEESEISWINQSDVSAIFSAYPKLEYFGIRGSNGLSLGSISHYSLKTLVIESGGLPAEVMKEIANAHLPNLEKLELWLGDEGYGNSIDEETLKQLLYSNAFPKLKSLGLCNDDEADTTAQIVAQSEILKRLETLDLSRGAIGDDGAKALLASPFIKFLKKLDVHHHYIADELTQQLQSLGIEVDTTEKMGNSDEEYRMITASE